MIRTGVLDWWWVLQKDLRIESRAWRVWPRLVALGLSITFLFGYGLDLPQSLLPMIGGSLCWITVCLASLLTFSESNMIERDHGCWAALSQYPVASSSIFLAKLTAHAIGLAILQSVVVGFLLVSWEIPVVSPVRLLSVMLLGNVALSAIGTTVGAVATGTRNGQGILALVLLPLWIPVLLGAAKATSLILSGEDAAQAWKWTQFLAACATVYIAAGIMLFEFAMEE